jgi:site-specific recombinase XerD
MQDISSFHFLLKQSAQSWIQERHLKPNTVRSYSVEIDRFSEWVCVRKRVTSFAELQNMDLAEFVKFVASRRLLKREPNTKLNGPSLDQTRRIIQAYLRWLVLTGKAKNGEKWSMKPDNVMQLAGKGREVANYNLLDLIRQAQNVLLATETTHDYRKLRDALLANMAFWCCATTSELANIKLDQVKLIRDEVLTEIDGEQARHLRLPGHLRPTMMAYLRLRRKRNTEHSVQPAFLFTTGSSEEGLQHWKVRRCVRSALGDAPNASPQRLRRAFMQVLEPAPCHAGDKAYRAGLRSILTNSTGTDLSPQMIDQITKTVTYL